MSLITRCPICSTMFRVVPDQLKISQAWVRCGHCDEVFDASTYLLPTGPSLSVAQQGHAAAPDEAAVAAQHLAQTATVLPQTAASPEAEAKEEVLQDGAAVSFVRHAHRRAFWQRPVLRWALALLSLVLLCVLILQVLLQYQEAVLVQMPQLSPVYQAVCQRLPCPLRVQRHIESLVIESSSFNPVSADHYRLSLVLKNTESRTVEMPALELTLTDSNARTLVRRVLLPHTFAGQAHALAAQSELPLSADFKLALESAASSSPAPGASAEIAVPTAAPRVAGYRVLLFYP